MKKERTDKGTKDTVLTTDTILTIDIDSTIADISKRDQLASKYKKSGKKGKKYYDVLLDGKNYDLDKPIKKALEFLNSVKDIFKIVYISGRRKGTEKYTKKWLKKYGFPMGKIIHREKGIRVAKYKYKEFKKLLKKNNIVLHIGDDEEADIEAAQKAGITPVKVQPNKWVLKKDIPASVMYVFNIKKKEEKIRLSPLCETLLKSNKSSKESKPSKQSKGSKPSQESKPSKQSNPSKESKQSKQSKGSKQSKQSKGSKQSKQSKGSKGSSKSRRSVKSVMLAEKFYDPNARTGFTYIGGSGKRVKGKWVFKDVKTVYARDPKGWYISEKYDGVRALWNGKNLLSRTGMIYHAPKWFTDVLPKKGMLDGELYVSKKKFSEVSGIVREKRPNDVKWKNVKYYVFDAPDVDDIFDERLLVLKKRVEKIDTDFVVYVKHKKIKDMDHAYSLYKKFVQDGAEGAVIKDPKCMYEEKRSKCMLKWKPVLDAEAVIIGYKEGKGRLAGKLGSFDVVSYDMETKKKGKSKFSLSGKLNDEFRGQYVFKRGKIMDTPKKGGKYPVIGDVVTYSFMEYTETGKPRQPIYENVRKHL